MAKNFIIAHDLGTTGNKATLYDQDGALVGSAFYAYDTEFAHTGWAEQDPGDWWAAVCHTTRQVLAETNTPPADVACITFSGQMMGCVPLDENARHIRSAIIWADQRSTEQEAWVGERIAPEEVYQITGHRLSASYSLTKALWIRDNQPDIYAQAHKLVHAKDAMIARLTGKFVTEPSDASGMNLYDLENGDWSGPILDASGLDPAKLPDIVQSIDVVGEVLPEVAEEVGVPAGTPVVAGGGDGPCAAVGAGVISEGVAYNYVGSSSWIAIASNAPIYDPDYRTFTFGHLVPGMFTPTGTMQAAGASYQWARNELAKQEFDFAEQLGVSPYELMNLKGSKSPVGADGLVFLPYLMGERSPRWNTKARGAFVGLTIRHSQADMIRAVLEGVTFNLRVILEAFTKQGSQVEAMRLIGGGAIGRFWNQIMADIYEMPVYRLAILEEATSMGAAVAGGVGVSLYPDFSIIDQMNEIREVIQPNPDNFEAYRKNYAIFNATYDALEPIYDMIAE